MAQIVSRGRPGPVVTVVELMRRCAPADEPVDDAAPIPVAALLRREGRSAEGLPLVDTPAVGEILSTLPARQPLLRRGAIAAGALLAAGSVFGLTAAMNAPVASPTSSGTHPDQAEPSAPASTGVLDAGQAAPSTWLPVAFPTLTPEADAPAAAAARAPQPAAAAPAVPVQAASVGGGSATRSASAPGTSRSKSVVGDTADKVGGTVRDVGKDTPVKDVTDNVGGAVSGLGGQVGAAADPIIPPLTTPPTTAPTSSATSTPSSAPTSTPTSTAPATTSAPSEATSSAATTVSGPVGES